MMISDSGLLLCATLYIAPNSVW